MELGVDRASAFTKHISTAGRVRAGAWCLGRETRRPEVGQTKAHLQAKCHRRDLHRPEAGIVVVSQAENETKGGFNKVPREGVPAAVKPTGIC